VPYQKWFILNRYRVIYQSLLLRAQLISNSSSFEQLLIIPSWGDLLCSVAFEKAHIKGHNVGMLFDEWQPEEGHPLPRVWIRIYRLPAKLREFSVLWAPGTMLGTTQMVDMVTSLRQDYGRVEVAVLNVDILRNMIDTVVIGYRLYSLPIQVEGREDNEEVEAQMDLGDGANDTANGADKPTE
jgi:hypothetical protein